MDNVTKVFSTRLKQLRCTKSQDEVAKGIGISRGALSYYEKGERNPDITTLASIAQYYGVSADYLLGLSDTPTLSAEEKAICDTIGLSQNSVEILKIHAQRSQKAFSKVKEDGDNWENIIWSYLSLQAINIITENPYLLGNIASYFFATFTHYTNFYDNDDTYHNISSLELFDSKLGMSYSEDYDFLSDAILFRIQREFSSIREEFLRKLSEELQLHHTEITYDTIRSILDPLINQLSR